MEETIRAFRYLRPSAKADTGTIAYLGSLWTQRCQEVAEDRWVAELKTELKTKRIWTDYMRRAKLIWVNEIITGAAVNRPNITTTKQLYQDEAMLLIAWLQGYAPQADGAKWDDETRDKVLKERRKWLANHLWFVKGVVEDSIASAKSKRSLHAENASGGTSGDFTTALQDLSL